MLYSPALRVNRGTPLSTHTEKLPGALCLGRFRLMSSIVGILPPSAELHDKGHWIAVLQL